MVTHASPASTKAQCQRRDAPLVRLELTVSGHPHQPQRPHPHQHLSRWLELWFPSYLQVCHLFQVPRRPSCLVCVRRQCRCRLRQPQRAKHVQLLLHPAMTAPSYYCTQLLLHPAVTAPSCYRTQLLLPSCWRMQTPHIQTRAVYSCCHHAAPHAGVLRSSCDVWCSHG